MPAARVPSRTCSSRPWIESRKRWSPSSSHSQAHRKARMRRLSLALLTAASCSASDTAGSGAHALNDTLAREKASAPSDPELERRALLHESFACGRSRLTSFAPSQLSVTACAHAMRGQGGEGFAYIAWSSETHLCVGCTSHDVERRHPHNDTAIYDAVQLMPLQLWFPQSPPSPFPPPPPPTFAPPVGVLTNTVLLGRLAWRAPPSRPPPPPFSPPPPPSSPPPSQPPPPHRPPPPPAPPSPPPSPPSPLSPPTVVTASHIGLPRAGAAAAAPWMYATLSAAFFCACLLAIAAVRRSRRVDGAAEREAAQAAALARGESDRAAYGRQLTLDLTPSKLSHRPAPAPPPGGSCGCSTASSSRSSTSPQPVRGSSGAGGKVQEMV